MRVTQVAGATWAVTRNLLLGTNVASLSMLRDPRKMLDYVSDSLFWYMTMNSNRGISRKHVYEVLQGEGTEEITLSLEHGSWYWQKAYYLADIISLCLICRLLRPKTIFEVGTAWGFMAYHFALNTSNDAKICTLDLPRDGHVRPSLSTTLVDDATIRGRLDSDAPYCFGNTPVEPRIVCLFGDSARFDYSEFRNKVDFFFIDGAHSYEYVRTDTLSALYCGHPGSVIAWHDFGRVGVNGVSEWLLELSKEHQIYAIPNGSLAFTVLK